MGGFYTRTPAEMWRERDEEAARQIRELEVERDFYRGWAAKLADTIDDFQYATGATEEELYEASAAYRAALPGGDA